MFKNLIFVLILILSSCASSKEKEWYVKDVSMSKRRWRYCHKSKDGDKYHNKGFCYISLKCYKKWYRKEFCENDPLFCEHGDVKCLEDNKWPEIKKGV